MLVGVVKTQVVVRLGSARLEAALDSHRVQPMDFTGKPLANFAYLAPGECESDEKLLFWAAESLSFVRENMPGAPPKSPPKPRPRGGASGL
jgi:hypothetical protein